MSIAQDLLQHRIVWAGPATKLASHLLVALNWCDRHPLCRENLGIPRREMPQIRPHAMAAFIEWAKEHSVTVHRTQKRVRDLRATQLEIDPEMVEQLVEDGLDALLDKRPMLASKDGYILDGHHRWAALLVRDPDARVGLLEFSANVQDLLKLAWAFPGVEFSNRVGEHAIRHSPAIQSNKRSTMFLSIIRVASAHMRRVGNIPPGMRTIARSSFLPPEIRNTEPNVDPEGTDLAIWKWERGGVLFGIAFQGNATKHLFFYRFRNEAERDRTIAEAIRNRKLTLDRKRKEQEDRRMFRHSIQPGDIYYTSWGYDQTNVDFYEVVAVSEKKISVRPIALRTVKEDRGADYVVAIPGKYTGPIVQKVPNANGFTVDNQHASKWDGKPKYQTAQGWGH